MPSIDQVYADWKEKYRPSHTSTMTASLQVPEKDIQKSIDDFIRLAERDYPNHQISGKVIKGKNNSITGSVVFSPIVAP